MFQALCQILYMEQHVTELLTITLHVSYYCLPLYR